MPAAQAEEQVDPGVDVLLFDLGGVLMDFAGMHRLAGLTGRPDDAALRSAWAGSPWVQAFEAGRCDERAFAEGVVRDWGLRPAPDEFLRDFATWPAGPYAGTLDLIGALSGAVPMGCLSNTNPVHWRQHLDRWGVVDRFAWRFVSHELGMRKPDPAVFAHVIRAVGAAPDRILFLDDSAENVSAARRAGIRAERMRGPREVRDALEALLPARSRAGRALRRAPLDRLGLDQDPPGRPS